LVFLYRCLPFTEKISILDVGSCYNPFKEFKEFLAVGLDLCPAVEVVGSLLFLNTTFCEVLYWLSENICPRFFSKSYGTVW